MAGETEINRNPRVSDNDRDEITVTLDGKELRGWSYKYEAERSIKMLCAREYVEGWCDGGDAMAGEWQPIETAPRDGTHVLLGDEVEQWVCEAFFENDGPGEGFWCKANEHWTDAHDVSVQMTHWMPLPEPPAPAQATSQEPTR